VDDENVAVPASKPDEERQCPGRGREAGGLEVETDQGYIDGDAIGEGRQLGPTDAHGESRVEHHDTAVDVST